MTLPNPIKLTGQLQKDHAVQTIIGLKIDEKRPVIVKFVKTDLTRTEKQRKLYFTWIGVFSKDIGESKEEMHRRYKKTIVFDMLKNRESTEELYNPVYEMYQQLVNLYMGGAHKEAERMAEILKEMISTNFLTVEENITLLKKVEEDASFSSVTLPDPDDYRRAALGY